MDKELQSQALKEFCVAASNGRSHSGGAEHILAMLIFSALAGALLGWHTQSEGLGLFVGLFVFLSAFMLQPPASRPSDTQK